MRVISAYIAVFWFAATGLALPGSFLARIDARDPHPQFTRHAAERLEITPAKAVTRRLPQLGSPRSQGSFTDPQQLPGVFPRSPRDTPEGIQLLLKPKPTFIVIEPMSDVMLLWGSATVEDL
ncbi:hypothetical protein H4R33_004228 [Dimargaris cristalligena]|uniref:Uncharacterized protein n=1 Tax=Dimargaris cristalligena TaxID=215637 RepID=A0A4P9ZQH8_9FUNG|nr:hypothetical protein H4R33_004228 [Dimargaris cristalligena]RKP35663.1 hypothetical protein BJ085DRAFT_39949 [Dimargaris cristalligena]|eukprot:RKP35663.1 hypothetical protein BJ085DRAFT_39949 [Dimargaris cristalligena]